MGGWRGAEAAGERRLGAQHERPQLREQLHLAAAVHRLELRAEARLAVRGDQLAEQVLALDGAQVVVRAERAAARRRLRFGRSLRGLRRRRRDRRWRRRRRHIVLELKVVVVVVAAAAGIRARHRRRRVCDSGRRCGRHIVFQQNTVVAIVTAAEAVDGTIFARRCRWCREWFI